MSLSVEESQEINKVQIEGLVVLKLVNHCQSSLPQMVTGQLLGLDVGNTLQITASFPFIYRSEDETVNLTEEMEAEASKYQYDMMRQLRDVNIDSNTVGWYCSTWLELFLNASVIETQFSYQQECGQRCICLIFDPLRTTHGKLYLKALRLKESFLKVYKAQDFTQEIIKEKKLGIEDIFEELPIEIHNNSLISAFISELGQSKAFAEQTALTDSCELDTTGYLTRSLEGTVDDIDDLWQSYQKYSMDQKRFKQQEMYAKDPAERKATKPSRLDSMLISKQIMNHCSYMEETALHNFENLYFADTLQKVTLSADQ